MMKLLKVLSPLIISLIFFQISRAQDFSTIDQQQLWVGATLKTALSPSWKLNLKLEERRFVFPDRAHQRVIPYVWVEKKFSEKWTATTGLWVFTIQTPSLVEAEVQQDIHEWRPNLRVIRSTTSGKHTFKLMLNNELRMLKMNDPEETHFDGPVDITRLRERLKFEYQFAIAPAMKVSVGEEILVNVASTDDFQFFDQNRLDASLLLKHSDHISSKVGYLHWFQPSGQAGSYFSRHVLILGFTYSM